MPSIPTNYSSQFQNANSDVMPQKSFRGGSYHAFDPPSLASTAAQIGGRRRTRRRGGCNLALTAAPVGGRRSRRHGSGPNRSMKRSMPMKPMPMKPMKPMPMKPMPMKPMPSPKSRRVIKGGELVAYEGVSLANPTNSTWNASKFGGRRRR